jgi:hypothetical protein
MAKINFKWQKSILYCKNLFYIAKNNLNYKKYFTWQKSILNGKNHF